MLYAEMNVGWHMGNSAKNDSIEHSWSELLALLQGRVPAIGTAMEAELHSQRTTLKLIASENYASPLCLATMGSWLSDKYAEGVPDKRYYAGCEHIDAVEKTAIRLACHLFGAEHAYVQPHSGADANLVAFHAVLTERVQRPFLESRGFRSVDQLSSEEFEQLRQELNSQRMMGMALEAGGHLTHGYRLNSSGRMFQCQQYGVDPDTGLIDYDKLEEQVLEFKPLLFVVGYSSYPRRLNFARLRDIARQVNAVLLADIAHFAGLVAGKAFEGVENPVPYCDIITTTTHKTLRGPRGGLILCRKEWSEAVDKGCPLVLGGPLPHVIAAKAVAFQEALEPSFSQYAHQVVKNAQHLAACLLERGVKLITGGTDNHLILMNVLESFNISGRQAEQVLRSCSITTNRNTVPGDILSPLIGSGVRIGTAALTTLGMQEREMELVAELICVVLEAAGRQKRAENDVRSVIEVDPELGTAVRSQVCDLLGRFPLYPNLKVNRRT